MSNLLWVFLGGGLGSAFRYGTTLASARLFGAAFPWGTLAVNLAGCFLAGLALGLVERGEFVSHAARLFIMVGFLGGLTTFSTFGLETFAAARAGEYWIAAANLILNNAAGILLVGLGAFITRGP